MSLIRFASDYQEGAHPRILMRMMDSRRQAERLIKEKGDFRKKNARQERVREETR